MPRSAIHALEYANSEAFIGIDPGWSGAMAVYYFPQKRVEAVPFNKMTPRDVWDLVHSHVRGGRDNNTAFHAVLEQVHAMPRQGVSSTFKFGNCFGMLEMALIAAEIPYDLVRPAVWQKRLGCLSGGDKNVTKKKAQRLFPKLRITHAVADAVLLAEFCRRENQ